MKCIYPDNITAISADEENASYPAANLTDEHPKKLWKATSRDAVVTAVVSSGGALAVIATNATSISLTISSGQTIVWESGVTWDSGISWDTTGDSDTTEVSLLTGDITGAAWFNFAAARTSSFTATITLTADAGQIVQAGCIVCGTLRDFRDPGRGIREGLIDYSIVKELNNGAFYTRKRDVVRTFDFSLIEDRASDFYTFMHTVARGVGPGPIAWYLVDGDSDSHWIAFARFDQPPAGSHDMPDYSQINARLVEVL
ncbi:MAG: hypothetical protein ABIJ57_00435 [Pseudomonadota bacterium]